MLRVYYVMCGNYQNALATYTRLNQTNDNFSHYVYAAEEVGGNVVVLDEYE